MSTMKERANRLHWAALGEKSSVKRKLFERAFIEIHNIAIEDAAGEIKGAPQSDIDAILSLHIEVPEE